MKKLKKPKVRRSFRFSDETMKQLDKGVIRKRGKREPWWDRTKVLEFLIDRFSRGKLKDVGQ